MSRIFYTKPSIGELELKYVTDAVTNGWGERCYEYIYRLQEEFASYIGAPYALATSSCTGALHLGLKALGIGPGDEVILGDSNWIASAAPIFYIGASPVVVDVLEESWCLDPLAVRDAITPKTRAIIAVHLYGNLAAMDELRSIADEFGLALIEDAAEALGSRFHGRMAGSLSTFSVFSFHGTKVMTTGEGGMLVTADPKLARRVEQLNNHGRAAGDMRQFWPSELGYKYKMSNLQAALGCAQLERIEELVLRKREIFAFYREHLLTALPDARMNPQPRDCLNSYWMPTLVLPPDASVELSDLIECLRHESIDARIFFQPLSETPVFAELECRPTPIAHGLAQRAFNLPSYHDMRQEDQQRLISAVVAAVRGGG